MKWRLSDRGVETILEHLVVGERQRIKAGCIPVSSDSSVCEKLEESTFIFNLVLVKCFWIKLAGERPHRTSRILCVGPKIVFSVFLC